LLRSGRAFWKCDRARLLRQLAVKQIRFIVSLFALSLPGSTLIADSFVRRFQKLDRNGDRQLSRGEMPKSFRKFKFDHADRNKDGILNKREIDWVAEKLAGKNR
jgi:hypothetical protein